MSGTLLQLVTQVCNEMGLSAPLTVGTATDLQTIQMKALVNSEGTELRRQHDWKELEAQYVITVAAPIQTTGNTTDASVVISGIPSTAGLSTAYAVSGENINQAARIATVDSGTQVTMTVPATSSITGGDIQFVKDTFDEPADFDRFENQTWWDVTNHWTLLGPDSPQRAAQQVAGIVTTGPRRHFRQVGRYPSNYRLWPPLGTVEQPFSIQFYYVSKFWVLDEDGTTYKATMENDDDISTLDAEVIVKGVKWRFGAEKSLPSAARYEAEYQIIRDRKIAADGGAPVLALDRRPASILLSPSNVADGNWPGNTT